MILIMLLIILLSIPAIQTYIAKKVTKNINETYGTNINIKRLGLNWKAEVDIREIYIADHHNDTLIYIKSLQTNILSIRNLIEGDLDFGYVDITQSKFYIKTYKGETDDNLYVFSEKFETGESTSSDKLFNLFTKDVSLTDSKVKIIDENIETPVILNLSEVNIEAEDFEISGPDITVNINNLSLKAKRGFKINKLASNFSYIPGNLIFKNLNLITEASNIKGDFKLSYGEGGMADFENNVTISAQLQKTELSTNDINSFYNEFATNRQIIITGDINGILNDFTFHKASIESRGIRILGNFSFKNLLKGDNSFIIQAKGHTIYANYNELRKIMPRVLSDLPEEIKYFGDFKYQGNTTISSTTLITEGTLNSSLGVAEINVELGNINDSENIYYVGDIVLTNFDLGKLTKTESLGTITSDLHFDGKGFSKETINTGITGSITSFVFEDYNYNNITISGNIKYPIFNGELNIDDPNINMIFKGLVDFSNDINQYDFEANIEFAELNKLNLLKRDSISVFAGNIIMDLKGTTVDDAEGTISFQQTFYQNEKDDFYFDDFKITSTFNKNIRTIEVISEDIINGKITGVFLVRDIPNLFMNAIGSIYTNYIPNEVTNNQYLVYDFKIYNKIIEVFVPELQFGDNTKVKGSVYSDESKFKLNFRSPEILLYGNYLGNVNVQVDNNNPLYNTYISIDSVYNGYYNLVDLNLINKTINDTLYIRSEFKGGKNKKDIFNLSLYHTINPEGKSVIGVKRSDITYKDEVWFLNENNNKLNKVVFDIEKKNINIRSLVLNHNNEMIEFSGTIRDTTYKNLRVLFTDVNIANITPEIDSLRLSGNINGRLTIMQKKGLYYPNSNITIDNILVNDVLYGDLNLQIHGNEDLTLYNINSTLTNNNVKSIDAVGEIDISTKNTQIRLNIELKDLNLKAFSPFGGDVITDIRGFVSGNARVSGNIDSPNILGILELENSGFKIPYLNIDFDLNNSTRVAVTKSKFDIGTTTITDTRYNTEGTLSGNVTHTNFGDWKLNLSIATNRLLVLDTPPDEDVLYYGTAFISGTADINGPTDELVIDVVATTEEGTSFKIPLSDTESIGDDSFIKFLSPKEKEARLRGEVIVSTDVKGLSLNFDLDINKNAEVEVVIDKVNNSTIKGRGAGTLLIEITTLGKFKMWGDFIVYEGIYDFRYGRLIRKEIEVERDGTITWDGNPSKAQLNLRAIYKTRANPSVLLDDPTINRKIPVNVIIDLSGEISQPNLNFDISFPQVSTSVKSELEYKLQDAEQREKQALFLISTGSFVSDGAAGQNALSGTLTEGLNAMVAELFSDSDSKFKMIPYYDIGNKTVDQETADELGFAITTQISERIIINGKVGIPVGGVNETSVAGDVEVQWLVNEDGSLRINFFNRQADIQFIGEDQIFEQGAGVSYSVDFDEFKELVKKLFGSDIELEPKDIDVIPDDNSAPVNFISKTKKKEN